MVIREHKYSDKKILKKIKNIVDISLGRENQKSF